MITQFELNKNGKAKVYRTAVYLRLSQEDGDRRESNSITNQKKLIGDYIKDKSEFCLVDEYVDDGWSGSNFDRPAWKQLCEDMECGAVNCVIVKDLSRFGRNYIEVGRYIQTIFPLMGVRLVAVNDNFDTLNEWQNADALTVPMKNLLNDIYCKDISLKVTAQLNAMRKRGECIAPFVPYGYKKDPKNRLRMTVDDNAAPTVRQIFIWKLEGYANRIIAKKLNDQGVLSPYEYRMKKGERMVCGFKQNDKALWAAGSVYNILHNECYTGTIVQGKWRKPNYRSKEKILLPKDEWTRVEGTHEAIIDTELFETVQTIMRREIKMTNGECAEILSGFLFCGECGRQMTLQSTCCKGKKYRYYTCKDCRDTGRKTKRVSKAKACGAILESIRKMTEFVPHIEKAADETAFFAQESREAARLEGQMVQLREEMERYIRLKSGLYADYVDDVLSCEEYTDYSQIYKTKIDKAKEALREVAEERKSVIADCSEKKYIRSFKKSGSLTSLKRPMLAELVEKVPVFAEGRMEVVFKNSDFIAEILETYGHDEKGEKEEAANDPTAKKAI